MQKAIWHYNQSTTYYHQVMDAANRYAAGGYTVSGDNPAGTAACAAAPGDGRTTMGNFHGTVSERIVAFAAQWLHPPQAHFIPYVFGGGDGKVPTGSDTHGNPGFDCSGLTLYAVYNATGHTIHYPVRRRGPRVPAGSGRRGKEDPRGNRGRHGREPVSRPDAGGWGPRGDFRDRWQCDPGLDP